MNYNKRLNGEYIASIGSGIGNVQITESEYNEILAAIRSCPNEPGKGYRLRTDLTWEEYDLPDEPHIYTEEELTAMTSAELQGICEGFGFTGNMNKAVMVYLILHAQN